MQHLINIKDLGALLSDTAELCYFEHQYLKNDGFVKVI
jgi:EAL domain-containing protein (putative c-di-GMP-specific phosphodiesterase class I)